MSLGISIVGGQTVIKRLKNGEELKGIFIKQVLEDSPAGKTNALKTGDKILEVNDVKILFSFETCFKTVIFNQKSSLHCWGICMYNWCIFFPCLSLYVVCMIVCI